MPVLHSHVAYISHKASNRAWEAIRGKRCYRYLCWSNPSWMLLNLSGSKKFWSSYEHWRMVIRVCPTVNSLLPLRPIYRTSTLGHLLSFSSIWTRCSMDQGLAQRGWRSIKVWTLECWKLTFHSISENDTDRLDQLVLSKVITNQVIISQMEGLAVCNGLNAEYSDSDVPVSCIYRICKRKLFEENPAANNAVCRFLELRWPSQVRDWVCHQIKESVLPIHPLLPSIIQLCNERMVRTYTEKISPTKIEALTTDAGIPVSILLLFLLLGMLFCIIDVIW